AKRTPTGWRCWVCPIPCATNPESSDGPLNEGAKLAIRARPRTVYSVTQKGPILNQADKLTECSAKCLSPKALAFCHPFGAVDRMVKQGCAICLRETDGRPAEGTPAGLGTAKRFVLVAESRTVA